MILGIRAHDIISGTTPELLASAVRSAGLDTVQLVPHKTFQDINWTPGSFSEDLAVRIRRSFEKHGIGIALLGAYFHWFQNDTETGLRIFKEHMTLAGRVGTRLVGTEVQGITTYRWGYNPANRTADSFDRAVGIAQDLQAAAEDADAQIGIEGAAAHVLSSPEKVRALKDRSGADRICFIFDLFNFLNQNNYREQGDIIDRAVGLYGDDLAVVHCKDFIPGIGKLRQIAPGRGLMDYRRLFRRLADAGRLDVPFILEGVNREEINTSIEFLRNLVSEYE